jgi:hypothetical protein
VAWAAGAAVAAAQELVFSAKVDATTAAIGDPVTLTLTLSGDITGVHVPPPQFPEGITVVSRSQSTQFSMQQGVVERSVSVRYVLVPQQAGTFQLGPFTAVKHQQAFNTEPIELTVKPASPPPRRPPDTGRMTL